MIVIGADPHKSTHTAAAVDSATGALRGSETVAARAAGHAQLLDWARALDEQRVWAIEDCRHVSGGLERFLVERGASTRAQNRLRWHLHDIDPELAPPARALRHRDVLRTLGARLA